MTTDEKKLDNPVYHSLTETHKNFAIDYGGAKFYHPDYSPFGGFIDPDRTIESIDTYSSLTDNFYVVGEKPKYSNGLTSANDVICNQMVLNKSVDGEINEQIIELQTTNHKNDLFNLVNLVQPGYFRSKTSELGSYYGIYKNDELIAVTGERMKMNVYTEVSAVVTHPDHRGKGYAKQLTFHTSNRIFSQNKIPYLHVSETNIGAIKLYEKLGFVTRRKICFWSFNKKV